MEDIIENNKLIAEFIRLQTGKQLGYDRWQNDWFDNIGVLNGQRNDALEFHQSWDWLMPVIAKCYNLNTNRSERVFDFYDFLCNDIKGAYKAVVEFIKWHNEQSK